MILTQAIYIQIHFGKAASTTSVFNEEIPPLCKVLPSKLKGISNLPQIHFGMTKLFVCFHLLFFLSLFCFFHHTTQTLPTIPEVLS